MKDIFKKTIGVYFLIATIFFLQSELVLAQQTNQTNSIRIDFIIEPLTYIPPFYKGKPEFVNQAVVKITAMPYMSVSGDRVGVNNLNFKWKKDGTILGSLSGVGKNSLTVTGGVPIRDITVSLDVLNNSGEVVAQESKIISAGNPKILFYENSPIYGILFNKAVIGNYFLGNREELRILAKPYFFSVTDDIGDDIDYKWFANGSSVTPSEKKSELLLRQTNTNLKGTASISLDVNHLKKIFQYTGESFSVDFGL